MTQNVNLLLRDAAREDAPLLLTLIRELADYEKLGHQVEATADILTESLFGPLPKAKALLAFVGGQPAGFALYFYNFSTFTGRPGLYLEDLYVRPAQRHLGVGTALFDTLRDRAASGGCRRMDWSVLTWNTDAIAFYRAKGARELSDWRNYRLDL